MGEIEEYNYTITIKKSDDKLEPWTARVKELQGCMSHGNSPFNALNYIGDAIASYLMAEKEINKKAEIQKKVDLEIRRMNIGE